MTSEQEKVLGELIVLDDGSRPIMKPMSDIAGSMAMLESVKYCQTMNGGTGLLLRKVYGSPAPRIDYLKAAIPEADVTYMKQMLWKSFS